MTHHAADCDTQHDPDVDTTRCYKLDADHTTVARILGHDTHRPDHVRLTAAQHGQIDELVGWADQRGSVRPPQLPQERRSVVDGLHGRAERDGSSVTGEIREAS